MRSRPFAPDRKQFLPAPRERLPCFVRALFKMLRCFANRVPLDENIFAAKFVVGIAAFRRVAMRLNTEMKFENVGIAPECIVDLLLRPNVKRSLSVIGFAMFDQAVGVFRGKEAAVF